jgi:hypothetical protein
VVDVTRALDVIRVVDVMRVFPVVALVVAGTVFAMDSAVAQEVPPLGPPINTLTDGEREAGWELLFDGQTIAGWRGYMMDAMPEGWEVIDGELTRTGPGRDIITTEQFENFDLTLEWKVNWGGNSGIFYRAAEGPEQIYMGAPEMQALDNENHADGESALTSAGANYGLHPAPRGLARFAGEWNFVRIVVSGDRVEHWMNGVRIVSYEFGSPDWEARVAASKFNEWPEYGRASTGHIGLQDHGDRASFRNIKIRRLP